MAGTGKKRQRPEGGSWSGGQPPDGQRPNGDDDHDNDDRGRRWSGERGQGDTMAPQARREAAAAGSGGVLGAHSRRAGEYGGGSSQGPLEGSSHNDGKRRCNTVPSDCGWFH
ncbi:unnamed protein product [Ectocarpus sp. CCAP 1310/34]|nr:unnamed protein product [Ectocarpus sp. CCAP 1310/34]